MVCRELSESWNGKPKKVETSEDSRSEAIRARDPRGLEVKFRLT